MRKHHEFAELFPELTGDAIQELAIDIAMNGLRSPIIRDSQGRILDGRSRESACRLAKVKPRYEVFAGNDEQKLQYVLSQNLHRRHLTPSQRSLIAAKLKPLYETQAKQRQKASGGEKQSKKSLPANLPAPEKGDARDRAGKAMAVSGKSVDMADRVHRKAIPEIVAAVGAGNLAVSAAATVAELPPDEQGKIMTSGGAAAVRAAASVIRRSANRGKSVLDSTTTPAPPVPDQSRPMTSPNTAAPENSLAALVELAKASSHFRRQEVIEALLVTLPEASIDAILKKCGELLEQRRNRQQAAKP